MPTKQSSDIENVDWSTGGGHYTTVVRFGSSSSQASQSSGDICRICHCESDAQNPLLTPCYCSGSLKYVHQACLQQWLTASETNSCELCKFPFIMHTKIKPFNEWRSLDISGVERRRLCCSVLFHCAAALCVIWSLCVLIERAADDVQRGLIDWPFWTKLAVVTVGLTGGVVFMYIQCRAYLHLCHRWKARNRILLIQNAPEKVHPQSPPSPATNHGRSIPRSNANAASLAAAANAANAVNNYNFNAYNYAAASACGGAAGRGANLIGVGTCGAIENQPASPSRCMMNEGTSGNAVGGQHLNAPQHGQIIANIESNSHNYDRDWTLDDVSQISSFRPCPQGSGSMTPFHDSIHNVLEHSINSDSNSVNSSQQDISTNPLHAPANVCSVSEKSRTSDLTPFVYNSGIKTTTPPPTGKFGGCSTVGRGGYKPKIKQYSNPSVFLGNRGILNDPDYPKINYRHSSVLMSPDVTDNLDKFLGKDLRRYSDTKLLASDTDILNSMIFNVPLRASIKTRTDHDNEFNIKQLQQRQLQHQQHSKPQSFRNSLAGEELAQTILDIAAKPTSFNSSVNARYVEIPQQMDLLPESIFDIEQRYQPQHERSVVKNVPENYCSYDPDPSSRKTLRRSLNTFETDSEVSNKINRDSQTTQIDKGRLFFKSLPNLSSSCESLIKK